MRPNKLLVGILCATLLLALSPAVRSDGPQGNPVLVYGYVFMDGAPVPDGTTVTLSVSREGVATPIAQSSTTTFESGKYQDSLTSPPVLPGDRLTVSSAIEDTRGSTTIILTADSDGSAWGLNMVNLTLISTPIVEQEGGILSMMQSILMPMVVLFVIMGVMIIFLALGDRKKAAPQERPQRKRSR